MSEHSGEKKIPEAEAAPSVELTAEELSSVSGGVYDPWDLMEHPLAEP